MGCPMIRQNSAVRIYTTFLSINESGNADVVRDVED